jgi:hypothetical protein
MNKLLEKLQKIKAHAESAAKIGSEAEAEAFAAMLQQLLTKHKLGMSDLDFEVEDVRDPVGTSMVDWQGVKIRKSRIAWIEQLAAIVAHAYFCKILVHTGSSHITLVGREQDRVVAEYVIVTLVRLAQKLAEKEFGKLYRQDRYAAHGFKGSFLKAFVQRINERLKEERGEAERSTSTALVRIRHEEKAVEDYLKSMKTRKVAMVRGSRRDHNAEGWRRGREVADRMDLKGRALNRGSNSAGALRR